MGALTEIEIFDVMLENLRLAAEASDELAIIDMKGAAYNRLREALALVEGACRQASAWREDTRWLTMGQLAAQCHQKAGGWLRGHKDAVTLIRTPLAAKQKNKMFVLLAQNLRFFLKGVENLKDNKTGRVGMILPEVPNLGRPQGTLIANSVPKSRLVLPPSMAQ